MDRCKHAVPPALSLPQEINAVVSRLGEGVREEMKRALYGTASVSGSCCFARLWRVHEGTRCAPWVLLHSGMLLSSPGPAVPQLPCTCSPPPPSCPALPSPSLPPAGARGRRGGGAALPWQHALQCSAHGSLQGLARALHAAAGQGGEVGDGGVNAGEGVGVAGPIALYAAAGCAQCHPPPGKL